VRLDVQAYGRRMTTKTSLALISAIAALSMSACGGGGDDDGGGGSKLAKADLGKKATEICTKFNKQSNDVKAPANLADATQAAPYFAKISQISTSELNELKALQPADEIKTDWDAFIAEISERFGIIDEIAAAAEAKDAQKGADLFKKIADRETPTKAAAGKVGALTCTE